MQIHLRVFLNVIGPAGHSYIYAVHQIQQADNHYKVLGCDKADAYPFCPIRITRRSSPYFVFIHLIPCSWGSTMRGQRSQLVRMVAFSVDIRSAGSPSFCQAATSASSVSMVRGSRDGVTGIGTWEERRKCLGEK